MPDLSTRPPDVPAAVAGRMIRLAEIPRSAGRTLRILDPAAGSGALIRRIMKAAGPDHIYQAYEPDEARWRTLRGIVGDALNADLLTLHPDPETAPDRIFMAPPAPAYPEYVRHARGFLAPGGRLVALIPDTPTRVPDRDLLRLVGEHGLIFKQVTGDRSLALIVLDRPESPIPSPEQPEADPCRP
jgi:SAM-dependent methyltransferase